MPPSPVSEQRECETLDGALVGARNRLRHATRFIPFTSSRRRPCGQRSCIGSGERAWATVAAISLVPRYHDELTAAFGRSSPSWTKLAEVLGSHGLVDGDGKPPTARGARGAWGRVRADIKAADNGVPVLKAAQIRVVSPLPAIERKLEVQPDLTEPGFQIARPPRAITSAPAPSPASASRQQQDPDEVIANLFARPKTSVISDAGRAEPEKET